MATTAQTTIAYHPSAEPLLAPWLEQQLDEALRMARELAAKHDIVLAEIEISGFESYEEDDRQFVLTCSVTAPDDAANQFWDELAEATYRIRSVPSPSDAENTDVHLEVAVRWDG